MKFLPGNALKEAVRQAEIGDAIINSLVDSAWLYPGLELSAPLARWIC